MRTSCQTLVPHSWYISINIIILNNPCKNTHGGSWNLGFTHYPVLTGRWGSIWARVHLCAQRTSRETYFPLSEKAYWVCKPTFPIVYFTILNVCKKTSSLCHEQIKKQHWGNLLFVQQMLYVSYHSPIIIPSCSGTKFCFVSTTKNEFSEINTH